ncbi:mitochondrial inner membrane mba1 [Pyrenophora seminiperda CCB06]|uniref:Mitochondrial inner membrane mba1 n=1 Tax=Pyrenophora seminiperda CCB06 TaxID=1302712 RepID=A0A3M7MEX2_9PLEO|nr:mitochondrial inner membrane mba1 [Pyrenophora seminiperda CCB06]
MSTQLPLRSMRIPALPRQCLFLRYQSHSRPHNLSHCQTAISTARAFSSTPSRPVKSRQLFNDKVTTRAAAAANSGPAPSVGFSEAQSDVDGLQEDIGILQHTVVRAPFSELRKNGLWAIPSYFWKLIKSKGTGFYSRYLYRNCIQKRGWSKYLPIDAFEHAQLKYITGQHYEQLYINFAAGTVDKLKDTCLASFIKQLKSRVAARGNLRMKWQLHSNISMRIVSHRATPLGEGHPDTAYRQLVVRCKSVQSMTKSHHGSYAISSSAVPRLPHKDLVWMPDAARESMRRERKEKAESGEVHMRKGKDSLLDNEKKQTVVEYLVLQKRVIRGEEENWKVWGFTQESMPANIKEDEKYWRNMLNYQVGGAA